MTKIPIPIQRGLQFIGIDGVQLIAPLFYVDTKEFQDKWAFEVELELSVESKKNSGQFPRTTRWFVVVDHSYPFGSMDIYPSIEGGITKTFPHQDLNLYKSSEVPWRSGKICIDKPIRGLGIIAGPHDPIGEYEERMKWGLQRALEWIRAAATRSLTQENDPYETPYYPDLSVDNFVYDESPDTYSCWKGVKPGEWGYVIWDSLADIDHTNFATAFFSQKKLLIRATPQYNEEKHILDDSNTRIGVWWYWPSTVVIKPYQAPTTWGELREVGRLMHVQVDQCLQRITRDLAGRDSVPLMIGYPIPKRIGGDYCEIHWQVLNLDITLPTTNGIRKVPKGFRSFERWQRYYIRARIYPDGGELNYKNTKNWHPDRLQARGRLSEKLRKKKILLIGCGALGSNVAELLTRGG